MKILAHSPTANEQSDAEVTHYPIVLSLSTTTKWTSLSTTMGSDPGKKVFLSGTH